VRRARRDPLTRPGRRGPNFVDKGLSASQYPLRNRGTGGADETQPRESWTDRALN
jgi:hypothetical protein